MTDYSVIQGVLGTVFASDLALSNEEANALLDHLLSNPAYKLQLGEALVASLNDPSFSWMDALEEYETYPASDEADARAYAMRLLWRDVNLK